MPMPPNLKAGWIKALRSGHYKQEQGLLKSEEGFCCLGVLADICGCQWEADSDQGILFNENVRHMNDSYLSWYAARRLGISRHEQKNLAEMNDQGASFDMIADKIESDRSL